MYNIFRMYTEGLDAVKLKIAKALDRRVGALLTGSTVKVVAVTKNHPPETVADAFANGFSLVGENRVQEALHKQKYLAEQGIKLEGLHWHLIGHLQTNKVRQAVGAFDLIESVDSQRLLELVDQEARRINKVQDILLQINIAEEPQKSGFSMNAYREVLPHMGDFPNLHLRGLMVIAPAAEDVETVRPVFRKGYELFKELSETHSVDILSMGMTNDFEVAIEEGANQVRLGRLLFGERDYSLKF